MIKVTIGQDTRVDSEISSSWITDQILKKRAAAGSVCASVQIDEERIHLTLATPGCGSPPEIVRPLSTEERKLLNSWARFHLDTSDFAAGELAAFLRPYIH